MATKSVHTIARQALVLIFLATFVISSCVLAHSGAADVGPDSTNAALRAQLDLMKEYQSDLLNTVYWALGVTVVIAGLLIGFGWFANFRVYERDKESLRQDLVGTLARDIGQLKSELSGDRTVLKSEVSDSIGQLSSQIKHEIRGELVHEIGSLDRRLRALEFRVMKDELYKQISTQSHSQALTVALRILTKAVDLEEAYIVEEMLQVTLSSMEAGGKYTANEVTRLTTLLDKLLPAQAVLRDKVRRALDSSQLF